MTKERKNELILLFNQGFTYERIAERFGDTPNSMHRWGSKNDNHFKDLYGIDKKPIDVTGQDLADAVIQMARNQRKHLEVSYLKVWKNCIRIYFKVI